MSRIQTVSVSFEIQTNRLFIYVMKLNFKPYRVKNNSFEAFIFLAFC